MSRASAAKPLRIALTGATGFVGRAVLDEALARGFVVDALVRRPQPRRDGVTWIIGDFTHRDAGARAALDELMLGSEAVIHVAGAVNPPETSEFARGNVDGTLAVIRAARVAGVPRLVFVSSLTARQPGLSAYGASKARAERLVRASGLDWTIVRPPSVYGPRDVDNLELFRAAQWGVVPVPDNRGRFSVIHVGDLARLLVDLVPGGELVTHRSFEPDDGRRFGWTHGGFARAIGAAVGERGVRVLPLSPAMMRLASRIERMVRGHRARLTADRVGYFLHPDWVVSAAKRPPQALWRPVVRTRVGLSLTARWYRDNGWL